MTAGRNVCACGLCLRSAGRRALMMMVRSVG